MSPSIMPPVLRKMRILFLLSLAFLGSVVAKSNSPTGVAVIVNSSVKVREISAEDLKAVFLGTKSSLGGGDRLQPVLETTGASHDAFLKAYLGKTAFALQTYYRSLVFSGRWSMPTTLRSDAEVIAYVEKTRGAIGYVHPASLSAGVRVMQVK